jgi:hypothetical protein
LPFLLVTTPRISIDLDKVPDSQLQPLVDEIYRTYDTYGHLGEVDPEGILFTDKSRDNQIKIIKDFVDANAEDVGLLYDTFKSFIRKDATPAHKQLTKSPEPSKAPKEEYQPKRRVQNEFGVIPDKGQAKEGGFYSPTADMVGKQGEEFMPAEEWKKRILAWGEKHSSIKEENKWSGVLKYLETRAGDKKVPKKDIIEQLDKSQEGWLEPVVDRDTRWSSRNIPGGISGTDKVWAFKVPGEAETRLRSDWTVRRLKASDLADLERLDRSAFQPLSDSVLEGDLKANDWGLIDEEGAVVYALPSSRSMSMNGRQAEKEFIDMLQEIEATDNLIIGKGEGFQSGHFPGTPNVVFHVRTQERMDAAGRKGIVAETIQSDWHQIGREKGYKGDLPAGWKIESVTDGPVRYGNKNYLVLRGPGGSEQVGFDRQKLIESANRTEGAVPPAPFKDTWHENAVKQLIDMAVKDPTIEWIGWPTGKIQAQRWGKETERYIGKVEYTGRGGGEYSVDVQWQTPPFDKANRMNVRNFVGDIKEIGTEYGKEVADAIRNKEGLKQEDTPQTFEYGIAEINKNVTSGGDFLKMLYDVKIPKFAKKYAEKLGGSYGKIDAVTGTGLRAVRDNGMWHVKNNEEVTIRGGVYKTEKSALERIADFEKENKVTTPIHGIEITPKMRGQVLEKGQSFYSGVDVTKTPDILKHIRENLKDYRQVVRSGDVTMLQRFWQSPHWLAKKHPEFKKIYDRELKREEDRATLLDKRLKGWETARNLNKKDLEKLRKIIWITEGKKIKSVTEPRFVWKDNEHGRVGVKGELLKDISGLNLKHYKQIGDYLKDRGVSQPVIDAYVDIRKHFDRSYAMIMNRMIKMKDVDADTITQYRQEIGNIQNYFPHQWYGNYYFHGLDKNGNLVARIQYYDTTAGGYSVRHKGMLAQAKKDYPQVETWTAPKKSRQLPEEVYDYPIPLEAMEQIINAASARVRQADPTAADLFQKAMPEAVSDVMKARGFGSHMIRRKGILGYEKQDILKTLHDFDSSFSGWLTKMEAAHDFSGLMRDIKGTEKPGLLSYTSRYVKDVMSNADRLDRIVDGMRAYFFMKYLGLNLKTGAVNALTQNTITGIPRLSIDVGLPQATRYYKIAGDDIVSNVTKGKNLSADENRMLLELHEDGTIRDQYAQEIKGRVHGRGSQILNGANNILGYFMSVSEKFNRSSMALTAFRLAKEGKITNKKTMEALGLKKGEPVTYEQAGKFAKDVTADAHFVYSKGNQPEWIRGRMKILRPMYSLASFSHNLMQLWAHMLRHGGRGMSAFALSMMATALFGGMMSIPFIKPLFDAWRKYTGTDPQKEIRDRLPEIAQDVVTYGIPSIFGVNIGGSLEIGNIDQKNPLKFIIGVPYSEIETASRVSSAYKSGEPLRAIEEMSPTFLKNPQAAWRLYTKGQYSITGKPINFPGEPEGRKITALEAVGKSLGFQPLSATKARDASEAMDDLQEFVKNKQNKMANQYANAFNKDDQKEMDRLSNELSKWNDKWMAQDKPEFTINLKDALRGRLKTRQAPKKFRMLGEQYKEEYQ